MTYWLAGAAVSVNSLSRVQVLVQHGVGLYLAFQPCTRWLAAQPSLHPCTRPPPPAATATWWPR